MSQTGKDKLHKEINVWENINIQNAIFLFTYVKPVILADTLLYF